VTQTKNGIAILPLTIDKYFAKKNTNIRSKALTAFISALIYPLLSQKWMFFLQFYCILLEPVGHIQSLFSLQVQKKSNLYPVDYIYIIVITYF